MRSRFPGAPFALLLLLLASASPATAGPRRAAADPEAVTREPFGYAEGRVTGEVLLARVPHGETDGKVGGATTDPASGVTLGGPSVCRATPRGTVLLSDDANGRVVEIDTATGRARTRFSWRDLALPSPTVDDLAESPSGFVYLLNHGDRVAKCDRDGKLVALLGGEGDDTLRGAKRIATDARSVLYVLCADNPAAPRVVSFDDSGLPAGDAACAFDGPQARIDLAADRAGRTVLTTVADNRFRAMNALLTAEVLVEHRVPVAQGERLVDGKYLGSDAAGRFYAFLETADAADKTARVWLAMFDPDGGRIAPPRTVDLTRFDLGYAPDFALLTGEALLLGRDLADSFELVGFGF